MNFIRLVAFVAFAIPLFLNAAGREFSAQQCQGTYMPYPAPDAPYVFPDTLCPLMVNHVGRHGARYPSSPKATERLRHALAEVQLNATGRRLLALVDSVIAKSAGQWGALSRLGMAEQRGIASRMYVTCRHAFSAGSVNAISSRVPRCIMSMDEFTHQLARQNSQLNISSLSGPCNSPLMRFFENNDAFSTFLDSPLLKEVTDSFADSEVPAEPFLRILSNPGSGAYSHKHVRKIVQDMWSVVSGVQDYGLSCCIDRYFTPAEQNALWSVANMNHYLRRSATFLSSLPADIAAPLLSDIIKTFDTYIADSTAIAPVQLRFGHAETLMPLLSLMQLPGCRYITDSLSTVASNWQDFNVSPMAANIHLILLRAPSGTLYLAVLLNERPTPLGEGLPFIIPYGDARSRLLSIISAARY